jgi:class 3 adenylate cyclase
VRRLILFDPRLKPRPYGKSADIAEEDWSIARRAIASAIFPEGPVELQKLWSNCARDAASPEVAAAYIRYEGTLDLSEFPEKVEIPTLIVKPRGAPPESDHAAGNIPDARMVTLSSRDSWFNDPDAVISAVREFLGRPSSGARADANVTGTAIILFADIADSTALTERLGDAAFRERARDLDTALRSTITQQNGTPIEGKLLGDGVLATFTSAKDAIDAALAFEVAGEACELGLHVGIHAGDVIREENNVFGGAVNIASRISGLAAPGEVLVSDIVRGLARTSASVSFEDRGEHEVKGVSEAMQVFAVRRHANA